MRGFRTGLLLVTMASLGVAGSMASRAAGQPDPDATTPIPFPEGFRSWTHVKSAVVRPGPSNDSAFSGLHNIYANAPAMVGYRTGRFPDEAVIVFDLFDFEESAEALRPTRRKSVSVMMRDPSVQGGWRFEDFRGGEPSQRAEAQAISACLACHLREVEGDGVFSAFVE